MAVIMATYDLRKPDHDYQPLYNYLKTFTYCWRIESVSAVTVSDGAVFTIGDGRTG
jgi:hypothetical protein